MRSCASARPGYRLAPPRATLYAASSWPRSRRASPSSRNARLDGSAARRSDRVRISSLTIARQLPQEILHALPEALHRRCFRLLTRRAAGQMNPFRPAGQRLLEVAAGRIAEAEQAARLRHSWSTLQQFLQRPGRELVLALAQRLAGGH